MHLPVGAGFLSREDAQAAFRTGAPSVALPVVGEVFDALDLDHDGRVSCRDFVAMMRIKQVPAPLAPQLHRLQAT